MGGCVGGAGGGQVSGIVSPAGQTRFLGPGPVFSVPLGLSCQEGSNDLLLFSILLPAFSPLSWVVSAKNPGEAPLRVRPFQKASFTYMVEAHHFPLGWATGNGW